MKNLLLWLSLFLFISCSPKTKIKIACIGDSITYGAAIDNKETNSYPAQLQELLGENYEVRNFGKNSLTLLSKGNLPYIKSSVYAEALLYEPDIAVIMLGTNDSKETNRKHLGDFEDDYVSLIDDFNNLESHPRIVIMKPIPTFKEQDTIGITRRTISGQIVPKVENVAYRSGSEIIDLFSYFRGKEDLLVDKVHPTTAGAKRIAMRVRDLVQLDTSSFDLIANLKLKGEGFNFHGYEGTNITYNDLKIKIVRPKRVAVGKPWIWRARFFGHQPQTDIALLEKGYHIVFCNVSGLFGSRKAVERWNKTYALMQKGRLAKKVVLEGMSRGGLMVYKWAIDNPEKIACIYADAPVLNIKSWPRRNDPDNNTWKQCKKAYGFEDEETALNEKISPIYFTKEIANAGYPMLHVVGEADDVVPVAENTEPFAKEIIHYGGTIQVIGKPGVGHHPHSLENPERIVNFILEAGEE